MIWLIANNHISTSKKPRTAAINFTPFDTSMMRKVPIDTSTILASIISRGRTIHRNTFDSKKFICLYYQFNNIKQGARYKRGKLRRTDRAVRTGRSYSNTERRTDRAVRTGRGYSNTR